MVHFTVPKFQHEEFLRVENITKIYPNGCKALDGISFKVKKGEFLAIIGLSGSRKSTLLKSINNLENLTGGKIFLKEQEIATRVIALKDGRLVFDDNPTNLTQNNFEKIYGNIGQGIYT